MPYEIENLTMRPVLLSLTSGETLRLSPRETSSQLRDVEVSNNPKIQKLKEQCVIALNETRQNGGAAVSIEVEEGRASPPALGKKKQNSSSEPVTNQSE